MWISAKKIGENLKRYYNCDSIQYTIQDGPDAGQTVSHLHMHIIPHSNSSVSSESGKEDIDCEDKDIRSIEDMSKEAESYREHFNLK